MAKDIDITTKIPANAPRLADKVKQLKDSVRLHIYKERGEEHKDLEVTEVEHDGKIIGRYVKSGDKIVESNGSHDSQASGLHEEIAKKVGQDAEDIIHTAPTAASKDASESAESKSKKDERQKENLESTKTEIGKGQIKEVKPKDKPKEAKKPDNSMSKMASMESAETQGGADLKKSSIKSSEKMAKMCSGLKKAYKITAKPGEISYAKVKPEEMENKPTVQPQTKPSWKAQWESKSPKEREDFRRKLLNQRVQGMKAETPKIMKEGTFGKSENPKNEKLEKDVIDLKTKKKIGETAGGKPQFSSPAIGKIWDVLNRGKKVDNRSKEEKIQAAFDLQNQKQAPKSSQSSKSKNVRLMAPESEKVWGRGQYKPSSATPLDHFRNRFEDGDRELQIFDKYKKTGHDEPYVGFNLMNNVYSTDPTHDKMSRTSIPVAGKVDPKGHLGKRVAQGGHDPFAWIDAKYGISKDILRQHKGKPLKISTRSDLIAHDDYIEHLDPKRHKIFMHMPSDNERIAKVLEPGAPSIKRRMAAAQKLKSKGFDVTIVHDKINSMQPEHNNVNHLDMKKRGFKVVTNNVKETSKTKANIAKVIGEHKLAKSFSERFEKMCKTLKKQFDPAGQKAPSTSPDLPPVKTAKAPRVNMGLIKSDDTGSKMLYYSQGGRDTTMYFGSKEDAEAHRSKFAADRVSYSVGDISEDKHYKNPNQKVYKFTSRYWGND